MMVALLTIEQKELLSGNQFAPNSFFYPIDDANGNWVISTQEVDQCVNENFLWVKTLQLIPFVLKIEIED